MCIIVDANVSAEVISASDDGLPVFEWVTSGRGRLVLGGRLRREFYHRNENRNMILEWKRAGLLIEIEDAEVDAREAEIVNGGQLESDDPHVIALADISRAPLLFTRDKDLMTDFGNLLLHGRKRRKVYSRAENQDLLERIGCPC